MGKIAVVIFCILALLAFATPISNGIHNWRTDDVTQTFSVTTGAAETTANIVLLRDLFNAATTEIQTTSSSISETPIPGTYTSATKTLVLTNLTVNQTRTITLAYYSESEDEYMRIIGPFLLFLIFGGIIGAIIYNALHKSGNRR